MQLPKRPVILGAGPCGLCLGWNFSNNGTPVRILERQGTVGGLALTFEEDGYLFDLGPHNLHPKYEDIKAFLMDLMGRDLLQYDLTMEIVFRDKRVRYPLKGIHVFKVLPALEMMLAGLNFLFARTRMFLTEPASDATFEKWIVNRFGRTLYNIYFGPYAEKAWKIPGSEISNYVAIRRVPVLSIRDYIRRSLNVELKHKHSEEGSLDNFYLRYGVGQLSQRFAKDIVKGGGHLMTGCKVLGVKGRNHRIESVVYEHKGETHEERTDFLFSTVPLPDLVELLDADVPPEVRAAAAGLDFCAERFVFLKINRRDLKIPNILYFSDPGIKFNRIYRFHDDCTPEGKSGLCVEFTCSVGDDVWTARPDELYRYALGILSRHDVLQEHDVEGFTVREAKHAYPRFRVGFETRMRIVLGYLSRFHNLLTLGRQGLFCYANIDDVLHMAFRAYESLNTVRFKEVDYADLFPRYVTM